MATSSSTAEKEKPKNRFDALQFVKANMLWIALAVLVVLLAFLSPAFRSWANWQSILMQNSIIGIVAMGMLVMMITGGFDLSVGAAGGASAVATAALVNVTVPVVAIVGGLCVGLVIGAINGVLIAKFDINSFIATFALSSIVTGVVFVLTSGKPIVGKSDLLRSFAYGAVGGVPVLFLIFLVFAIITHALLTRTKWGHWVYSLGANKSASYLSGVPTMSVQVTAFVYGGLSVGIAGVLLFGQASIGQPSGAADWPLDAIAICVIGGVSLSGGVGRVVNVVAAVFLLGVVKNGLNQLGISPYWQPAITGAIILAAVLADQFSRARSRK